MKKPGVISHILCILLALLLTVVLFAGGLLVQCWRISNDKAMYLSAGATVTEDRMSAIAAKTAGIAAQQSFHPETVADHLTADAIRAYDEAMVDWFVGLLHGTRTAVPVFDTAAIEEAVRADELFRANVSSAMLKITARDKVGGAIASAVSETVFPLRTSVIRLGMSIAATSYDIPGYINSLPKYMLICLITVFILMILTALLMYRSFHAALPYLSGSMLASALLSCIIILLVWRIDLPAICGQMSALFAAQVSFIETQLLLSYGGITLLLAAVGIVLMLVYQHIEKKRLSA